VRHLLVFFLDFASQLLAFTEVEECGAKESVCFDVQEFVEVGVESLVHDTEQELNECFVELLLKVVGADRREAVSELRRKVEFALEEICVDFGVGPPTVCDQVLQSLEGGRVRVGLRHLDIDCLAEHFRVFVTLGFPLDEVVSKSLEIFGTLLKVGVVVGIFVF